MLSPTKIIQTVTFLDSLAAGLIMPQLPNHARSLGCEPLLVGTMGALYAALQLVAEPVIKTLSEVKGRKPILLLTLSFSGLGYLLLGITSPIVLFLGLITFLGFLKQIQFLTKSLTPDYEKDENKLSKLNQKFGTLSIIAMCTGPMIGGYIMDTDPEYGFTYIAFIVGGLFAVNSALIRRLPMKEIKNEQVEKNTKENLHKQNKDESDLTANLINSLATSAIRSMKQLTKIDWNILWEVFVFRVLMLLCIGMYMCNFAVFLKIKFQITPLTLGYITSFLTAVEPIHNYFIGYINKYYANDKDYSERTNHVFLTLTLSLIGMILAPTVSFYLVFLLPLAVCTAMGREVSLKVILSKTEASQKEVVVAVTNDLRNWCGVVAPLIAGVVGQYVGILYVVYVAAFFGGLGVYISHKVKPGSMEYKNKSE